MKLILNKKYYTESGSYQGTQFLMFITKLFKFKWFTDCGSWFIYVTIGNKWIRFSDCGTLNNFNERDK